MDNQSQAITPQSPRSSPSWTKHKAPIADNASDLRYQANEKLPFTFHTLPLEVKQLVFFFLDPHDLVNNCCRVSKEWNQLSNNPTLWRTLFEKSKDDWKVYQSASKVATTSAPTSFPLYSESRQLLKKFGFITEDKVQTDATPTTAVNWKALYLEQNLANTKKIDFTVNARESTSTGLLSSFLSSVSAPKVHPIPMFGEGLESSAKKLLYNLMWSPTAPYKITTLHSGVEGIGSGVGFNINGMELNLVALHKYEDRGIFSDKIRPLWKGFFKEASGLVFVVDNSYSIADAKEELHTLLLNDQVTKAQPLLILVCQENKDTDTPRNCNLYEMATELGLDQVKDRKWSLRWIDVATMAGVWEGLYWLSLQI